jgi:putative ABC transport system ATP-binding protein
MRVNGLVARARALHCIERVGLERRINHLPGELSGGEQQRACLARALVNSPAVLLADEPTGNLDPASAEVVLSLLLDLAAREGRTVILTSHSREVASRCGRVIRLDAGKLVSP